MSLNFLSQISLQVQSAHFIDIQLKVKNYAMFYKRNFYIDGNI